MFVSPFVVVATRSVPPEGWVALCGPLLTGWGNRDGRNRESSEAEAETAPVLDHHARGGLRGEMEANPVPRPIVGRRGLLLFLFIGWLSLLPRARCRWSSCWGLRMPRPEERAGGLEAVTRSNPGEQG